MNPQEAEKILNEYGSAISDNPKPFHHKSLLPCSKARIRMAYFIYIPEILNQIETNQNIPEIIENLLRTYSMLDGFIEDTEADRLNLIGELGKQGKLDSAKSEDKAKQDEWISKVSKSIHNQNYFEELNDFVAECIKTKLVK